MEMLKNKYVKNTLITLIAIGFAVGISFLLHGVFTVWEHVTTVFVFAVFIVSLLTDGYVFGIAASFIGVVFINYAFTVPYFHIDFSAPESIFSAAVMIIISLITSALTTKLKKWQKLKAIGDEEMMRANLLRAVSHDLRTPLTTIYGSSSAIADNYETLSDAQRKKLAEGIKEDAEWLIRIVENLLSVTKITSGRLKLIKTSTVLEELIDSVILKFKKRYSLTEVKIELPDELVIIPMDAILIEQVLINFLENAVQHAKGMKNLTLRVFLENEYATFEVADDGCGIPREIMDKIFTGVYNIKEMPNEAPEKNAGIGLSVCATIIKAHGGEISAENLKEGGCAFRFRLEREIIEDDAE